MRTNLLCLFLIQSIKPVPRQIGNCKQQDIFGEWGSCNQLGEPFAGIVGYDRWQRDECENKKQQDEGFHILEIEDKPQRLDISIFTAILL